MVRVILPLHLKRLAGIEGEVALEMGTPVTIGDVLNLLEEKFPMLRGTIRDHGTLRRRPMVRYFICEEDWSTEPTEKELPTAIAEGREPFMVIGAIAGG